MLSLGKLTPTGSGFANYTATGGYKLAGNTMYWVVVDYLGAPSWGWTDSASFTGTGMLGGFTNSFVDRDWRVPQPPGFQPYLFEVDAAPTATAEPSGLVLLLTGIGVILLIKARRPLRILLVMRQLGPQIT